MNLTNKLLAFLSIMAGIIGYSVYHHRKKTEQRTQEVTQRGSTALEIAKAELAEENLRAAQTPPEDETQKAPHSATEELEQALAKDVDLQKEATIAYADCDALKCLIVIESKIESISKLKRTCLKFLQNHPEFGPYWKFKLSEDDEKSFNFVISNHQL